MDNKHNNSYLNKYSNILICEIREYPVSALAIDGRNKLLLFNVNEKLKKLMKPRIYSSILHCSCVNISR